MRRGMLRRIRYTQFGVIAGGILALILSGAGGTHGVNPIFLFIWVVVGNIAIMRLKCVRCGKRLATMPPFFCRGFGLHTCAHCGEKQPP
jgi:hypothetical protein